jgi:hypothetical protein
MSPSPHTPPIHATILDLNNNPIRPNHPLPVLRRTASGHLFQPHNQVVKAAEILGPATVGVKVRAKRVRFVGVHDDVKVEREEETKYMTQEGGECMSPMDSVTSLASTLDREWGVKCAGCVGESEGSRCWIAGLCEQECGRRDSDTLAGVGVVRKGFDGVEDDVWMQVAGEYD